MQTDSLISEFLTKAEEKGKSMTRKKNDTEIISFHYDDHEYKLYLVNNFCMARCRYKVVRDDSETIFVKHFTEDMFEQFKNN